MSLVDERRVVVRWVNGVLLVFSVLGFSFGTWLSRLPAVRDQLDASTSQMSVFIMTVALGSLAGLALSGRAVTWLGPRRTLLFCIIVYSVAMSLAGTFFWFREPVLAGAALAVFGFTFSTSDVAVNVSGANAERLLGLPRMPIFHAAFSLGSVTSMLLGALAEAARVPVPLHFTVVFAMVVVLAVIGLRAVPHDETSEEERNASATPETYHPWRDPRVYAVGLVALSMALSEGVASDWLPLSLVDGRGLANETGTLMLGVFLGCMTAARFAGSWLLQRFGRVWVLRSSAVLVVAELILLILVPATWAMVAGAALWGMGSAFGFPVAISAAADNPRTAVRSVAAVSVIAYGAFLIGPLSVGFIGEHFGLLSSFWLLVLFAVLAFALSGSARERA